MRILFIVFIAVGFLASTELSAARANWGGWETVSNKKRYRLQKNEARRNGGLKIGAAFRIRNKTRRAFCAKMTARKGKNYRPRFHPWVFVAPGHTANLGGWRRRNMKRKATIRAKIRISRKLPKCTN